MEKFYVTFGLGYALGANYLVAYAPTEQALRQLLNDPINRLNNLWASVYPANEISDEQVINRHRLKPLARQLIVTPGGRPQDLYANWEAYVDEDIAAAPAPKD